MMLNINDSQGIELLHFIFERELKPPFREGEQDEYSRQSYYNRDNEHIGWLTSADNLLIKFNPYWNNILHKVCQVFGYDYNTLDSLLIGPNLQSWMETQINVEFTLVQ